MVVVNPRVDQRFRFAVSVENGRLLGNSQYLIAVSVSVAENLRLTFRMISGNFNYQQTIPSQSNRYETDRQQSC